MGSCFAQVQVNNGWVVATLAVQKSSAAYLQLQSAQALTLIGASSPVAGVVSLHHMSMQGNVMQMRALARLALPAGATRELTQQGDHLMLMDLKQQLKAGDLIPLTLRFEAVQQGQKKIIEQQIMIPVRAQTDAGMEHH